MSGGSRLPSRKPIKDHSHGLLQRVPAGGNTNPTAPDVKFEFVEVRLRLRRAKGLVEYKFDLDERVNSAVKLPLDYDFLDLMMSNDPTVENLMLQLLESLAGGERSYEEVMNAWRTSCPRLPVWEEACDRGLVKTMEVGGRCMVRITPAGLAFLRVPHSGEA